MTATETSEQKRSIWTSWIHGIKDAWIQAKLDYQQESAHAKVTGRNITGKRFDDLCILTKPRAQHDARRKRRIRAERPKSVDLRAETITAQHERYAQQDNLKRVVPMHEDNWATDAAAAPSILNASFLESIRTNQKAQAETESPLTHKRKHKSIEGNEQVTIAEEHTAFRKSPSFISSDIDEEYIMRVQRRVQQLEAELEAARIRLSLYERAETTTRTRTKRDRTPERPSRATCARGMESEDSFILSPGKLDFSPIRVELADVSNGEIARREAVQALKQRIKVSPKS